MGFKSGAVEWWKRGELGILVGIDMGVRLMTEILDLGLWVERERERERTEKRE